MKTFVLTIGEPNHTGAYPLSCCEAVDGAPCGELEVGLLPADLNGLDLKTAKNLLEPQATAASVEKLGKQLHALFPVALRPWSRDPPVRTMLNVECRELRALPWEIMYDTHYLFRDGQKPLSRGSLQQPPDPIVEHLRVLLVHGRQKPQDPTTLLTKDQDGLAEETWEIKRILLAEGGTVQIKEVWAPVQNELLDLFRSYQPHVFHFCGHGYLLEKEEEEEGEDEVYLGLDEAGASWRKNAIKDVLRQSKPHLCVLNACLTGVSNVAGNSLADIFLEGGASAVISMQGPIQGGYAAQMSAPLYEQILLGTALDETMATCRQRMDNTYNSTFNWALPILKTRCEPEKVIRLDMACRKKARTIEEFQGTCRALLDREEHRTQVGSYFKSGGARPIVLRGGKHVGKTTLLHFLLERAVVAHWCPLFVDMAGKNRLPLDLLGLFRDGDPNASPKSKYASPLKPSIFKAFNHLVCHFDTYMAGKPIKGLAQPGNRPPLPILNEKQMEGFAELGKTFVSCLKKAAKKQKLLLLIDNFAMTGEDMKKYVIPHFFRPLLDNKRIRLVIAFDKNYDPRGSVELQEIWKEHTPEDCLLKAFPVTAAVPLMVEYLCIKLSIETALDYQFAIPLFARARGGEGWLYDDLQGFAKALVGSVQ